MEMSEENTKVWRELYQKHAAQWDDRNRIRYLNIPNDQEDIDDDELAAARELVDELAGD